MTIAGDVVCEGPPQPSMGQEGGRTSHHAGKLDNGNYLLIREEPGGGNAVEELTPELDVVWYWTLPDHVPKPANAQSDWCDGNSATLSFCECAC